uniref:Uncharacterized mitochondrial protein AtMg00810-like n=1 Tax=Nicotiana tabacum TaxID=4097 RepID=A0A1S4DEQ7_TOBAC|nr:PREDICTED: uncharacterized mitochondrial protein AtMg00810-like [Nicotiana tabacum]
MKFLAGVFPSKPGQVCLLRKSLYGLKQTSRQWYARLAGALSYEGYSSSLNDYSLFYKQTGALSSIIVVYVDDILLTGDDVTEITQISDFLSTEFRIQHLGDIHYFLGAAVSSPLDPYAKLHADLGAPMNNPTIFFHLVGKLNYLTNTRPDLSFAVLCLSQYMQQPTFPHFSATLRVLRYLRSDPSQGIFLSANPSFDLLAFCDADWASCRDSRRSVSEFFVTLGGAPISWKSKKQVFVSLSSAEAEYHSMRRVTTEITWLVRLLADLSTPATLPVPTHSDSQAAIHIAKNPVFHERTKHVELDCHFVRQQFLSGIITLSFVPSAQQLADIFTKPLSGASHRAIMNKLGVLSLPPT